MGKGLWVAGISTIRRKEIKPGNNNNDNRDKIKKKHCQIFVFTWSNLRVHKSDTKIHKLERKRSRESLDATVLERVDKAVGRYTVSIIKNCSDVRNGQRGGEAVATTTAASAASLYARFISSTVWPSFTTQIRSLSLSLSLYIYIYIYSLFTPVYIFRLLVSLFCWRLPGESELLVGPLKFWAPRLLKNYALTALSPASFSLITRVPSCHSSSSSSSRSTWEISCLLLVLVFSVSFRSLPFIGLLHSHL